MTKKILFIAWDGPQTNYLESLFLPIFQSIKNKDTTFEFHVMQFTWAPKERVENIKQIAANFGIIYRNYPVYRQPISSVGSLFTALISKTKIQKYINKHKIDIVIPRSTMPAIMINRINLDVKLIFDADGLPIEERADFNGLSRKGKLYKWLRREELKILYKADAVLTRSNAAVDYHQRNMDQEHHDKFFVVLNGREADMFNLKPESDKELRKKLKLDIKTHVFIYCGSLGPQYGWQDMINIVKSYIEHNPKSFFIVLTGSPDYATERVPMSLRDKVLIRRVNHSKVPSYLSIANTAFAIREPTLSMKGVAPIKLGEYLLSGLPTIASKGIGDTEEIVRSTPNCFLFDHNDPKRVEKAVNFLKNLSKLKKEESRIKEEIQMIGKKCFSMEKSVDSYLKAIYAVL